MERIFSDPQATTLLFPMAALAGGILTSWVRTFALRFRVVARRDDRRRHGGRTPLLGGTAFYVPLIAITVLMMLFGAGEGAEPLVSFRFGVCFCAALTLVYGTGVLDDFIELRAAPKLLAQTLAALLVLLGDIELPEIVNSQYMHPAIAVPLAVLWIVGVSNAVNMIDGLDGLAAGLTLITSVTLASIIFSTTGQVSFAFVLTLVTAGVAAGFLFHNFHPAKIFLGDSGSLLIGLVLAVISIKVDVKRSLFISLSMPLFVLGIPIFDVFVSIVRRKALERSVFKGDRSHIHHRLQQLGLGQRGAVILLWMAGAYLGLTSYFLAKIPPNLSLYAYVSVAATLGFWYLALYFVEMRLSRQISSFTEIFIKENLVGPVDKARASDFFDATLTNFDKTGKRFLVLVINCGHLLKEISHESPERLIAFYQQLYAILRSNLRPTDTIARISEHVFVAILPEESDEFDNPAEGRVRDQIKELQQSYFIFQSNKSKPEGFEALHYPRDRARIARLFGARPAKPARAA